jgi:hypothetical protein
MFRMCLFPYQENVYLGFHEYFCFLCNRLFTITLLLLLLLLLLSFLISNANFAYVICSSTCCETLYVDGFSFWYLCLDFV